LTLNLLKSTNGNKDKKDDDFDKTGCVWKGTSPFCAGGCVGVDQIVKQISKKGDGAECLTGQKVLCCPGPVSTTPVKLGDGGKAREFPLLPLTHFYRPQFLYQNKKSSKLFLISFDFSFRLCLDWHKPSL